MLTCPTCPGSPKLQIVESRPQTYGGTVTVWRRRRCATCKKTYYRTIEVPADWAADLFSDE